MNIATSLFKNVFLGYTGLQIGNQIEKYDPTWRGKALSFGVLALSAMGIPSLSRHLSNWTGIVITSKEALITFGCAAALKTLYLLSTIKLGDVPVKNHEEARNLYFFELGLQQEFLSKDGFKVFYQYDLHTQVILNLRFTKYGLHPLPFGDFREIGTEWTQEELAFLASIETLSKFDEEKRQKLAVFMCENHLPPWKEITKEDLSLVTFEDLTAEKVPSLSRNQLLFVHMAIHAGTFYNNEEDVQDLLCQAFLKNKFSSPLKYFEVDLSELPPLSDPLTPEENYLRSWYTYYYLNHFEEWKEICFDDQIKLSKILQHPHLFIIPKAEDLQLNREGLNGLQNHFSQNSLNWFCLPIAIQEKFNTLLSENSLKPLPYMNEVPKEALAPFIVFCKNNLQIFDGLEEEVQTFICHAIRYKFNNMRTVNESPFATRWNKMIENDAAKEIHQALKIGAIGAVSLIAIFVPLFFNSYLNKQENRQ